MKREAFEIKREAFEILWLIKLLDSFCSVVDRMRLWIISMCIDFQKRKIKTLFFVLALWMWSNAKETCFKWFVH